MSRNTVLAVALALLPFGLRLWGLERMLPHRPEPDAHIVYQLRVLRGDGEASREHRYFRTYPSLIAHAVSLAPGAWVFPTPPPDAALEEHLAAAARPHLVIRFVVALLSSLLVPLTYALARGFLGRPASLVAALLVATSLLHVSFSQQARPHGAHATLALFAVLASARLAERRGAWRALAACAAAALALSTLQNGAFALLPLALACALAAGGGVRGTLAGLGAGGLAVLAALPFYPVLPRLSGSRLELASQGGHPVRLAQLDGGGLRVSLTSLWENDPLLLALALGGLVVASIALVRRGLPPGRRRTLAILAAYAVPYAAYVALDRLVLERMLLPLVPYLACLAAGLFQRAGAALAPSGSASLARRAAVAALGAMVLAWPLHVALAYTRLARAPDTLELAAAFLEERAPEGGTAVLGPGVVLPLASKRGGLAEAWAHGARVWSPWIEHQGRSGGLDRARWLLHAMPPGLALGAAPHGEIEAWLDAHPAQVYVMEVSRRMLALEGIDALLEAVRRRARQVAVISGEPPGAERLPPIDYQNVPQLAERILAATAFGPRLEILER
ncbi:MAG TPA: glycosyltransferase family 39 protein [Planctomycetota bacterium]|nr:glycosyltransferase family 39 protein [Planctomycetota bacterium]